MQIKNPLLKDVPNIEKLIHEVQSKCGSLRGAAGTLKESLPEAKTREMLKLMAGKAIEIQEAVARLRQEIESQPQQDGTHFSRK